MLPKSARAVAPSRTVDGVVVAGDVLPLGIVGWSRDELAGSAKIRVGGSRPGYSIEDQGLVVVARPEAGSAAG